MITTGMRTSTNARSEKPAGSVALVVIFAVLSLVLGAPTTAASPSGEPITTQHDVGTLDNSNPIDWTAIEWFVNHQGHGFPLRIGQHDDGDQDGFGERHIRDGHVQVPPAWDIQEAVEDGTDCWYLTWKDRWNCYNDESSLFVVYSTKIDDRSGDNQPFGVITAFYKLPPGNCGAAASDIRVQQCDDDPLATSIDYRGPDHAVNGEPVEVSARLGDNLGIPMTGQPLTFGLGSGANRQTCDGMTSEAGVASCTIDQVDQPVGANVPLTIDYAGNSGLQPSTTTVDLALQTPTTTAYTGPEFIANGEPVTLAAALTDYRDSPVVGRAVELTLGNGDSAQSCIGTTDTAGEAACTIEVVDQPLREAATVPATAAFSGDSSYLSSEDAVTVKLEYYTGRSYGLEASIDLVLVPVDLPPQPDTGQVRTAESMSTDAPCTATVTAVVATTESVCAEVTTTLTPGTITSSSSVERASIGLPGVPVIEIAGLTTTATATCEALDASTSLTLTVGGVATPVEPGAIIDLAGGARLTVGEQVREDGGITVTGVRLTVPGTDTEILLGHSAAAVHHCAP